VTREPPLLREDGAHRTLTEWLAAQLRREIRSGELPGGTHLRQTEVAERFGVSSTPVREAFAVLERAGLLTSSPHRGVVVASPTLDDLRENFEIRMRLEAFATELAVPNLTAADLGRLHELLDEMAPLSLAKDYAHYYELNAAFHDGIYELSGRPRLHMLINQLRAEPAAFLGLYARPPMHLDAQVSNAQHAEILAACEARAAKKAAKTMAEHLDDALGRIVESIDSGKSSLG